MKTNSDIHSAYEAPTVEIVEVQVEKGFAATSSTEDYDNIFLG